MDGAGATVTVVLPTYNPGEYVFAQIDSILSQGRVDLTLLVTDDGSTDGTWGRLEETYASHPRVVLSRNRRNRGQIATLEGLLGRVATPFFAIADQDDVWLPDKVARSLRHLTDAEADLVYTDRTIVDAELNPIVASAFSYMGTPPLTGKDAVPILIKNPISACTLVARTSLLETALPFPCTQPRHDQWLGLVAATAGGVAVVREPTVLYRLHGGNSIGAVRQNWAGLASHVARTSGSSMRAFLNDRLAERRALASALAVRIRSARVLGRYARHYSRARLIRVLSTPVYFAVNLRRARAVGYRNLMVDALLTAAAPTLPAPTGTSTWRRS